MVIKNFNLEGVNNMYKIKKKSLCSLTYSEISVLENMHCSKLFNLLANPKLDILENFKDPVILYNYF